MKLLKKVKHHFLPVVRFFKNIAKIEDSFENVLVTTLDSDNKPYKEYFASATYEFIVHEDRKNFHSSRFHYF